MFTLQVNGQSHDVDVSAGTPLLWALRDVLGMTGTKFNCGIAQCGACTVHLDGQPVRSRMPAVGGIGSRKITTIEGIGATEAGAKIQKSWLDLEVVRCGYCQSGQITSAAAARWFNVLRAEFVITTLATVSLGRALLQLRLERKARAAASAVSTSRGRAHAR